MIKISHPLPSTSACSLAAVWCGIAMEAPSFLHPKKAEQQVLAAFLLACAFSLLLSIPSHLSPTFNLTQALSDLSRCLSHFFSPHIVALVSPIALLSPVSYYMVLPHSCLFGVFSPLLPTHHATSLREREIEGCVHADLGIWSVSRVGRRSDRQPKKAGSYVRRKARPPLLIRLLGSLQRIGVETAERGGCGITGRNHINH